MSWTYGECGIYASSGEEVEHVGDALRCHNKEEAAWKAQVEALQAQLAACAAGPWRYDVENAPKGVQLVCWQWTPEGCNWHLLGMKKNDDGTWDCGYPNCEHDPPIAFAAINPPEVNP